MELFPIQLHDLVTDELVCRIDPISRATPSLLERECKRLREPVMRAILERLTRGIAECQRALEASCS
jgi:hypothetical protein